MRLACFFLGIAALSLNSSAQLGQAIDISSGLCELAKTPGRMEVLTAVERKQAGLALIVQATKVLDPGSVGVPTEIRVEVTRSNEQSRSSTEVWTRQGKTFKVTIDGNRPFTFSRGDITTISIAGQPAPQSLGPELSYSLLNPALPQLSLWERLKVNGYSVSDPVIETIDGTETETVTTSCTRVPWLEFPSRQKWYFDRQTHLPIRLDFVVGSNGPVKLFRHGTLLFGGFTSSGSDVYAASLTEEVDGHKSKLAVTSFTVSQFSPNVLGGNIQ